MVHSVVKRIRRCRWDGKRRALSVLQVPARPVDRDRLGGAQAGG